MVKCMNTKRLNKLINYLVETFTIENGSNMNMNLMEYKIGRENCLVLSVRTIGITNLEDISTYCRNNATLFYVSDHCRFGLEQTTKNKIFIKFYDCARCN